MIPKESELNLDIDLVRCFFDERRRGCGREEAFFAARDWCKLSESLESGEIDGKTRKGDGVRECMREVYNAERDRGATVREAREAAEAVCKGKADLDL
jgi:hypothetical protein